MESEPLAGMPARFRKVPYRAVRDTSLPAGALRLLIAIACNADADGKCALEAGRLASEVGLTTDDIARYSVQLAEAGYVSASSHDRQWHYRLVLEPEDGMVDSDAERLARRAKAAVARPRGVSRLMRAWRDADRFSFWLRTVLSPDDTDLFWSWALRNEDDYHNLVQRFGDAKDDGALEALLRETVDVVGTLGASPRRSDLQDRSSSAA